MSDEWSPYGNGGDVPKKGETKKPRQGDDLTNTVAREQLKSIVERVENLEEEKAAIGDDIKEVFAEAKANGFDTKILRQVIRLRKKDFAERQEEGAVRDLYMQALGMLPEGSA